jgi:hypothetical protein
MNIFRSGTIAAAILAIIALAVPAAAQTVTTVYAFPRNHGPIMPIMLSKSGALFGEVGGKGKVGGEIYELTFNGRVWKQAVVHKFTGLDGSYPNCSLIEGVDGALYGATLEGGTYNHGVAFKLTQSDGIWTETVIHNFGGAGDGASPASSLIMDKYGNLYGVTDSGGEAGGGIAYELSESNGNWNETILHSFGANGDGSSPEAALVMSGNGDLYGTAAGGGVSRSGTVFKLENLGGGVWTEKLIYSFSNSTTFIQPLILGPNGVFYGVAELGGTGTCFSPGACGIVFELSRVNGKWTETVLHNFSLTGGDGGQPIALIRDSKTNTLYGVTEYGGQSAWNGYFDPGYGTIFNMTQTNGVWSENVMHSFINDSRGTVPLGMIRDTKRNVFYGVLASGFGAIFQMTP